MNDRAPKKVMKKRRKPINSNSNLQTLEPLSTSLKLAHDTSDGPTAQGCNVHQ